ncbi:MAG: ferritin-like domain-containing protein [Rhodoferax sp.]
MSLRADSLAALQIRGPAAKCAAAIALRCDASEVDSAELFAQPLNLPCRPDRPELVSILKTQQRSVHTVTGRAALIHSLAHIELNAVDLGLDIVWRFPGMPTQFYLDWAMVAQEEARHYGLLADHLSGLGFQYGDFPAHSGLWDMAQKTSADLLARLALVPRTLEARGLDASPRVRDKLLSVGDRRGAEILSVILQDEIGHVATGNRWYRWLCSERGIDPMATYTLLALRYSAPRLRGPFNLEARRAAGFDEDELAALLRVSIDAMDSARQARSN